MDSDLPIEGTSLGVSPDCKALRLVRPECQKCTPDGLRPGSNTFTDQPDSCMSVFLEEIILREGRKPEELLEGKTGYRICYLTLSELEQDFNQEILNRPDPNFPGHVEVRDPRGKRTQSTKSKMSQRARWYEISTE